MSDRSQIPPVCPVVCPFVGVFVYDRMLMPSCVTILVRLVDFNKILMLRRYGHLRNVSNTTTFGFDSSSAVYFGVDRCLDCNKLMVIRGVDEERLHLAGLLIIYSC